MRSRWTAISTPFLLIAGAAGCSQDGSGVTGVGGGVTGCGPTEIECFDECEQPTAPICVDGAWSCIPGKGICGTGGSGGTGGIPADGPADWTFAVAGDGSEIGRAIAVDAAGNLLVAGAFTLGMDLGGEPLVAATADPSDLDAFLGWLASDGHHLYSGSLGFEQDQTATDVDVTSDGDAVLSLVSNGDPQLYVSRIGLDGAIHWSRSFAGGANGIDARVCVDPDGTSVVAGRAAGTVDFGVGPVPGGSTDAFVVKLASSGQTAWARRFTGATSVARDVACIDGAAIAVGFFSGTLDVGAGIVLQSQGETDAFAVALDGMGDPLWATAWGGIGQDLAHRIAGGVDGSIAITGSFQYEIDFGGGPVLASGQTSVFVAGLAADGAHRFSRAFTAGPDTEQMEWSVAVRDDGATLVAGQFVGGWDLARPGVQEAGAGDVGLTLLDGSGNVVTSESFGDAFAETVGAAAFDAAGAALLTGSYYGAMDPGGGALPAGVEANLYVVRIPLPVF